MYRNQTVFFLAKISFSFRFHQIQRKNPQKNPKNRKESLAIDGTGFALAFPLPINNPKFIFNENEMIMINQIRAFIKVHPISVFPTGN